MIITVNEILNLAFLGVGGGMLLTGIAWIIGFAVSLACNIFKNLN